MSGIKTARPHGLRKYIYTVVILSVVFVMCLSATGCNTKYISSEDQDESGQPVYSGMSYEEPEEEMPDVETDDPSQDAQDAEDGVEETSQEAAGSSEKNSRYYQDGVLLTEGQSPNFEKDVKQIVLGSTENRLVDYPKGYELTYPGSMNLDFRYSPDFVRIYDEEMDVKVYRDTSWQSDVKELLSGLPSPHFMDPTYIEANRLTIHEDKWIQVNGKDVRVYSLTRTPAPGSPEVQNSYTYAYIPTEDRTYYSIYFRSTSFETHKDTIYQIIESFKTVEARGQAVYSLNLEPVIPKWNEETAALYQKICNSEEVIWGFFTPEPFSPKGKAKIQEVEAKLEFKFPVIMWYRYLGHEFPVQGMQEAYDEGRIVELTYQIVAYPSPKNPNFEVLDGVRDDEIRAFARQAKEFGHPFLFRLNNEMNSTWVPYAGHYCLCDPDIFIKVWQRIYRIFEEEGVNNAIWIFNPNDVSYPPRKYNSHVAYYPGNEYVQMIGLTGYNTGDYFQDYTGEKWRSFTEIYDRLWHLYKDLYAKFPWIITEFACSSVGGDKEAWIDEMFENLPRYKNIKIAVWWSYYDPDPRPESKGVPARRYWLDEKPEYIEAFKRGLKKSQSR